MTQPEIQTQPQFEQACRDLKRIYDAYKSIKNSLTAYRLEFDIQLDESTIGDLIALTQRDRESDVRTTNTPGQNITLKPPAQPKSNQPGLQSQPSKSAPKLQMQTEEQKQPRKVPPKLQIKQKEDEIDYVNLTQGAAQPQIKKKGSLPTTPTRQQMVAEQESLLLTFREQPAPQASAPPVNFPVAWSQPDQSKPSTNPQLSSAWPQPEQTKPSTNPQLPSAWPQPDQSKPSTTPSQAWPQPAQVKPSGSQQIPVQPLAQQAPPQNPLSNVAPPQQPGINSMFDTPRPGSIPMNPGAFNSNPKPQQAKPQQMSASQQVRQPTPFQQAQIQPSAPQKPQPAQQIPAQAKAAGQVPQSAQQAPQLSAPQKPQPIQQIPAQIKAVGHVPMSAQQAPQPSQTPNWQQAPIQQKPQNQPSINQAAQMPFPGYPNMQQDAWSIPQHQIIAMQQMALAQHAQMAQSKYGTPPANMAQMQMQMQAMNLAQQGAPSGKQFPVQHQKQMQPSAQQMAAPRPQAAAQRPPAQPTPIQNQPQNQIPKQQPQQPVSNQNMPNQPQIPSQPNPQVQKQRQKRRSSEADVKKTVQSAMVKALVPNAVPVQEPQQAPAVPEQSRMAQQPVAQEDNQPPVAPPPQQPQFAVQPAWPTQQRSNTPQQANNVGEENSTNRPVVQQPPPQNKPIGAVSFPQAQVDQHLKPQAPVAPPAQQYTIEIAKKMLANSGRLILNSEIQRDHVAIANGASAVVYRAMYRNQLVAVKYMLTNQMNQNNIKEFIREIDALMNMNHKNLVQFMGAQIEGTLAIVMEYCEGDSLFKLLHQSKASLSWAQKLTICKDTANAIYYMHKLQKPIIHRDLKSLNILLKKPVNGETDNVHALVTDFGISRHLGDTPEQFMTGQAGTYHWMAPEVISSQPYNLSADIYSLGIVFWEVCSRKTPYDGLHPVQIAQQVVFQNLRPNLNVLPTSAAKMKALIQSCWAGNPTDRPTIDQVVNILNTFA